MLKPSGNAQSRRRRGLLSLLLGASLFLNFQLGLALMPSLLALLVLPPLAGSAVAAVLASLSDVVGAARSVPWVPTPAVDLAELMRSVDCRGKSFLDLGSGDGRNLLLAMRDSGCNRAVGIELSPALVALSRMRIWWAGSGEIVVHSADLLRAELPADIDFVYMYLSDDVLARLAPRLACAYGGRRRRAVTILSRDFVLPGWGEPTRRVTRGRTQLLAYDAGRVPRPSEAECAAVMAAVL